MFLKYIKENYDYNTVSLVKNYIKNKNNIRSNLAKNKFKQFKRNFPFEM